MLTDRAIKANKPQARPYKLFDGHGLYLYVTPKGSRLWRQKYRWGERPPQAETSGGLPISGGCRGSHGCRHSPGRKGAARRGEVDQVSIHCSHQSLRPQPHQQAGHMTARLPIHHAKKPLPAGGPKHDLKRILTVACKAWFMSSSLVCGKDALPAGCQRAWSDRASLAIC
jgi:hypothetical protein